MVIGIAELCSNRNLVCDGNNLSKYVRKFYLRHPKKLQHLTDSALKGKAGDIENIYTAAKVIVRLHEQDMEDMI